MVMPARALFLMLAVLGPLATVAGSVAAHPGHAILAKPWDPQSEFVLTTAGGSFVLVVAPNLVDYDRARATALARVGGFCQGIGRTAPSDFDYVKRYSDFVLDGWEFGGSCE